MDNIENTGIALLKKGQKGLFHALFSRLGLILILLILQIGVLFGMFAKFEQFLPHFFGVVRPRN